MYPDHKIAKKITKYGLSKIRHYMLATLAECNMHYLTSKSQQRVICDTQI